MQDNEQERGAKMDELINEIPDHAISKPLVARFVRRAFLEGEQMGIRYAAEKLEKTDDKTTE